LHHFQVIADCWSNFFLLLTWGYLCLAHSFGVNPKTKEHKIKKVETSLYCPLIGISIPRTM